MKIIVAVDKNWGIGRDNDLLFSLKEDMRHFVAHTLNKTVVMGYKTLLSLPHGMPLKNRTNIVLGAPPAEGYIAAKNLDELFEILKGYDSDEVYVIGGAMTYRSLLDYCDIAYITKVDADGSPQVYFENLDARQGWQLTEQGAEIIDNGYKIKFCKYLNVSPLPHN